MASVGWNIPLRTSSPEVHKAGLGLVVREWARETGGRVEKGLGRKSQSLISFVSRASDKKVSPQDCPVGFYSQVPFFLICLC